MYGELLNKSILSTNLMRKPNCNNVHTYMKHHGFKTVFKAPQFFIYAELIKMGFDLLTFHIKYIFNVRLLFVLFSPNDAVVMSWADPQSVLILSRNFCLKKPCRINCLLFSYRSSRLCFFLNFEEDRITLDNIFIVRAKCKCQAINKS